MSCKHILTTLSRRFFRSIILADCSKLCEDRPQLSSSGTHCFVDFLGFAAVITHKMHISVKRTAFVSTQKQFSLSFLNFCYFCATKQKSAEEQEDTEI